MYVAGLILSFCVLSSPNNYPMCQMQMSSCHRRESIQRRESTQKVSSTEKLVNSVRPSSNKPQQLMQLQCSSDKRLGICIHYKRETKGVWPSILCRLCGRSSFRPEASRHQEEDLMNILSACNS